MEQIRNIWLEKKERKKERKRGCIKFHYIKTINQFCKVKLRLQTNWSNEKNITFQTVRLYIADTINYPDCTERGRGRERERMRRSETPPRPIQFFARTSIYFIKFNSPSSPLLPVVPRRPTTHPPSAKPKEPLALLAPESFRIRIIEAAIFSACAR